MPEHSRNWVELELEVKTMLFNTAKRMWNRDDYSIDSLGRIICDDFEFAYECYKLAWEHRVRNNMIRWDRWGNTIAPHDDMTEDYEEPPTPDYAYL